MKTKESFQALMLGLVLAAGFTLVLGVAVIWIGESALAMAQRSGGAESPVFLKDGSPLIMRSLGQWDYEYFDLKRNPLPEREGVFRQELLIAHLPAALASGPDEWDTSWRKRLCSFSDGRMPGTSWYFVSDGRRDGTGYFVGYDSKTCARVGYLGTAGFRPSLPLSGEQFPFGGSTLANAARLVSTQLNHSHMAIPNSQPFGHAPRGFVSPSDVYVLAPGGTVYHADLEARTVHVALEAPDLCSAAVLCSAAELGGVRHLQDGAPWQLAVRTKEAIMVLDERGALLRRYVVPDTFAGREINFAETTAGEALMYANSPMDSLATEITWTMAWVGPAGVRREEEITLACVPAMQPMRAGIAVVPSPLALLSFLAVVRAPDLVEEGLSSTYAAALSRALFEYAPGLLIAQLVAALLALLCHGRQVRFGTSPLERVVWPIFVLVLGLPGWIGFRFGRNWPVLEPCPACSCNAPQDREWCRHCEEVFAVPPRKGTEVFA
jgi:hypothetical protein